MKQDNLEKEFFSSDLHDDSKKLQKVKVEELIQQLSSLPKDLEIVIYPKYQNVDGYHKHRFRIGNVLEMEKSNGYKYCAILF